MAAKIAEFLDILSDGRWHMMTSIQAEINLDEKIVQQIVLFLNKYGFIKVNHENGKVRVSKSVRDFIALCDGAENSSCGL